jgi:hypothetical protein
MEFIYDTIDDYYYIAPEDFETILSRSHAILFIIGTLLIPIQTSTEEYVLEVT